VRVRIFGFIVLGVAFFAEGKFAVLGCVYIVVVRFVIFVKIV